MNQCSGNSGRNPAMPFNQLVESRNRRRIAQNHGDLAATGNAGGLALGAGLWLGHDLVRLRDFRHLDELRALLGKLFHHGENSVATASRRNVIRNGFQFAAFRRGVGADHAVEVHGSARHLAHVFDAFAVRLPAGQLLGHRLAALFRGGCNCEQALFNSDPDKLAGLFTKIGSKGAAFSENLVHGLLQSGLIPPMCESYSVTSDNATTILQVAA